MVDYPLRVFCISGKRKTGKDFVASLLQERWTIYLMLSFSCMRTASLSLRLPKKSVILRISAPIKEHWARTHQLSYSDLLSDGTYKEEHRLKMIQWSEEQREKDPSCFCRETIHMFKGEVIQIVKTVYHGNVNVQLGSIPSGLSLMQGESPTWSSLLKTSMAG